MKEGFSVGLEGAAVQAVCTRQAMLPGLFSGGPSSFPHLYKWGVGDGQGSLACYSPWVTKSQTGLSCMAQPSKSTLQGAKSSP